MAKGKNRESGSPELGSDGENVVAGSVVTGNEGGDGSIAGIPIADPGSVTDNGNIGAAGDGSEQPAKRKRGRPAGSGSGTKPSGTREKAAATTVTGIEKLLYGIHAGLASATGVSEFQLDRTESALLAQSVADVASHYDTTIDPKTMAWIGLFGVLGSIYGPRVAAYRMRSVSEKNARRKEAQSGNGAIVASPMSGVPGFDNSMTVQ